MALPYHQDAPTGFAERLSRLHVTLDIARELRMPILRAAARPFGQRAARMLMPEASVDLDRHPVTWKHNVRRSWQVGSMQPEACAHCMKKSAHGQLRPCVLLSYGPHYRRR